MNSNDLAKKGFQIWYRFSKETEQSLISILPISTGVYVIRREHPFGRLFGQSDIFYIGSATNIRGLKGRIRQYFHPGPSQKTNQRILALLESLNDLELSFLECFSPIEAKNLEKILLYLYEDEHGELPPLNRRE